MLHPNPTPPPLPSLAFSEERAVVLNGVLSEGFVTAKKEKEAHFFRRRSHSTVGEQCTSNSSSSPSAVRILVGSRESIEQWVGECGPGSSCLWAQAEDFSQNAWGKVLSGQLKLTYRLQSEQSLVVLPVLNGTILELSPPALGHGGRGRLKKPSSFKKAVVSEVKRSSFVVEPESPTPQSPSNVSSNSTTGGDMSLSDMDSSIGLGEKETSVVLVIPEKAYRQLVVMVSPGGIIREYQELLRRSVACSHFLDVNFQLLDLHKWLKHHPFAAFLEGCDVMVVRRGEGSSGLRWALVRFDFGEGLVRSTKGEDLNDLELIFGNQGLNQVVGTWVGWWVQNVISNGSKAREKRLENSSYKLDWKIWTIPLEDGDSGGGPLTRLFLDALRSEDTLSIAEINSLKSLFGSKQAGEPEQVTAHSAAAVKNIQTVLATKRCKGLSSKEQCALSDLRSDSEELKLRGLRVLLNLLLGVGSNHPPATGPMVHRSPKGPCLVSSYSNSDTNCCCGAGLHVSEEDIESSLGEHLKKRSSPVEDMGNLSLGGSTIGMGKDRRSGLSQSGTAETVGKPSKAGTFEATKDRAGSQTGRALKAGERFEEKNCLSEGAVLQKDCYRDKHEVEPICVTDWLTSGFLEALLEKFLVGAEGGAKKGEGLERGEFLNVEVALKACLRVLEIVPKEGSSQLAKLLVLLLQETCEDFMKMNLNLKQHGDCEPVTQIRRHDRGTEGSSLAGAKFVHAGTKPTSRKLQEIFEQVLRFCKLLSLLASQSPLLGGPFVELGGLDLVLDLYFCLVKRFPVNLRLGALSSAVGASRSLEQILPGEVTKRQDTHLQVLPCILPSACICRVAQACLMDHCMSPKKERVDFAWPPSTDWKALCPFKHLCIDSPFMLSERSHHDDPCDSCLDQWNPDFNPVPEGSEQADLNKPYQSTCTAFTPEHSCGCSNSYSITTSIGNDCSFPCAVNCGKTMGHCQVEGSAHPHMLKQRRPYVPRLPLNTLRSSTSRFGPSAESRESRLLHLPAEECHMHQMPSMTGASTTSEFEIFTAFYDVKLDLLQTMGSLFLNCSRTVRKFRSKLLQKFQNEEEDQLVLQFLPDIIGGFLNTVPESTSRRTKSLLFQVISLIDKGKISDECKVEEAPGMPCRIGSGPNLSSVPKRLVDNLLLEVGERLRILVCHLTQMLATSKNLKCDAASNSKQAWARGATGPLEYCDPLLENCTISSGHLLSLWVDVGLLLRVLADFVSLWPEGDSVQCVLNSCGRQLEGVFGLLAEFSSKSNNWSLAQILTMDNLLKLLIVCIKGSVSGKRPESQIWRESDTFFWQLLVMNDLHWNCVKSFTNWVVMESCQGCLRNLFEGYQKVLWEPLEIYYSMLGEQIKRKSAAENGVDMSRRSIFPFLRLSILMMKKRLKCQGQGTQPCPPLYMGRLPFLLDFLMNPVDGLLMNVIRSPDTCVKLNKSQNVTEGLNLLNLTKQPTPMRFNPSNPEPTLPANHETLYSSNLQEQCRKCASTPFAANCAQKVTPAMKQESLGILADIFGLKSFDHHDEQANHCLNPRAQNPFLFRKYVSPFLELIFFSFLRFYNKKVDYNEPSVISPLSLRISASSKMSVNSGQPVSERMMAVARISGGQIASTWNDRGDVCCSGCSRDNHVYSVACVTYGQVLRALAQNQTEDVSRSFQQMRVMKFLVQQIGLEYEVSQVATPGDVELPVDETSTEFSLKELQSFDSRDFESRITRGGLLLSGERAKAPGLHDKVEGLDLLKRGAEENMTKGHKMKSDVFGGSRDLTHSTGSMTSALLLSEGRRASVRSLKNRRILLDQTNHTAHELTLGSPLQNPHYRSGCHSARDVCSALYRGFQLEGSSAKLPFPNSQHFPPNGQKEVVLSKLVPFGQWNDDTRFEKGSLSEHGTTSTRASSQRNGGMHGMSNRSSEESKGKDRRHSITRANYDTMPDDRAGSTHLRKISTPSHVAPTASVQGSQQAQLDEEKRGTNTVTIGPEVRYTGRFFDLNEEVERELAQEGFPDAQHFSQETQQIAHTKPLHRMDDIQEENNLEKGGSNPAPTDLTKSGNGTTARPSDSESSLELEPGYSPKQEVSRPAIPKLNLSKSVRKGGPAISSDTSMDFRFFPSSASTLESKSRLNTLVDLQKEIISSDRDSKSWGLGASYETERLQRRLYQHAGLHMLLLELFVSLMLTPQGTLETCYSDRYPMENCKLNAPFFLSYHLNHAANAKWLPCLSKRMKDFKPAAFRILKLTWRALFNPRIYINRIRIARGAISQVYSAKVRTTESVTEKLVVLKIVDVPKAPYDPCKFFDVYSEVEILEKFLGEPAVCQILDYGVDAESFILVLKHYKCSLCTWRRGQSGDSSNEAFSPSEIQRVGAAAKFVLERLPLYLEVYSAVLQAVKILEIENVVHYDLKCDNILLDPVETMFSESEFWTPSWPPADPSNPLPFRICIADFGQSKASAYLGGECTVRNRGTEFVKSPEMLKLLSSQSQRDSDFNLRNTDEGVGKAVDVWSLGCLLYELLTGEYLFYDEDWLQFFMRVTLPSEELITKEKAAKLDNYGPVVDLLKFILVRDPLQRPSLDDVAVCVEQLQLKLEAQALADTTNGNESPTLSQILSEEYSNTDESNSDEKIFFSERKIVPDQCEPKQHARDCLDCLRGLICHCQCGGE